MDRQYNLMCGVGRASITPKLGAIMYGYAPGRPAECVGDDLNATAILLTSRSGSAMLITCDICAINPALCDSVRKKAGEIADIPAECVTISATHTHSGPNTSIKSGWGDVDADYIENIFVPGICQAAKQAADSLQAAEMGVCETDSHVGMNRRVYGKNGGVYLGQNPEGLRDPKMTVVSFRGENHQVIANMVHYCCHGTAAGGGSEITRDWPGVMMDMMEKETGAVTGFYAGVEGDQGPNLPNGETAGDYQMAKELGARAGADAIRAFRAIDNWQDAPVSVHLGTISVPYEPLATKEKAQEELEKLGTLERIYAEERYSDVNDFMHWSRVLDEYESGRPFKTHWEFAQNITTIGSVAIVPCPFEAFVELGLRLRACSPYKHTLSLCNAHGCYAYLPTQAEIPKGGYEVWHFKLAMRTTYPLPDTMDDYWVNQNAALLLKD